MRFAICDDEKCNNRKLKAILTRYSKAKDLTFKVDTFLSGEELIKKTVKYDLVFLDVDMPDLNGIEVGKIIGEHDIDVKIIYVTNYEAYMKDAFTVRPFGYVLKPITDEKIFAELDEFFRREEIKNNGERIIFNGKNGEVILTPNETYCIEVIGKNILKATTKKGVVYIISSLNDAFLKLERYNFVMTHQSFIVNLLYVRSFETNYVALENDCKIPVAQKKFTSLKKEFYEYLHTNKQKQ